MENQGDKIRSLAHPAVHFQYSNY